VDPLFYQFDLVVNRINPNEGNKESVTEASHDDVTGRRPHMGYRDVDDAKVTSTSKSMYVGDETTLRDELDTTTVYDYDDDEDEETTLAATDVPMTTLVGTPLAIDELDVSVMRQKITTTSTDVVDVRNGNNTENDVNVDDDDEIDDHHDYGSEMTTEEDPSFDDDEADDDVRCRTKIIYSKKTFFHLKLDDRGRKSVASVIATIKQQQQQQQQRWCGNSSDHNQK